MKNGLLELTTDSWCCEGRGQVYAIHGTISFLRALARGPKRDENRERFPTAGIMQQCERASQTACTSPESKNVQR